METFEELQKSWMLGNQQASSYSVNKEGVTEIVNLSIRRERNRIFGYFWISYFWQLTIYASLSHLVIRYWGDWNIVSIAMGGIVLYIPFTTVFILKYSRMALLKSKSSVADIYSNTQKQHTLLSDFFKFKKKFDWIGIPITCFLLTAIIFELWVPDGLQGNPIGDIITFLCAFTAFIVATLSENKKRFKKPLLALQLVMNDLKETK